MNDRYFQKALQDFAFDAASGDAIRHLADSGMSIKEIAENISFPTPVERIRSTVWKHFLDKGIICLEDPSQRSPKSFEFVKEYTSTGRATFRMVEKESECSETSYYACDFGRIKYKDQQAFMELMGKLEAADREYVEELPWPLETVYHVADERMDRIMKVIGSINA